MAIEEYRDRMGRDEGYQGEAGETVGAEEEADRVPERGSRKQALPYAKHGKEEYSERFLQSVLQLQP